MRYTPLETVLNDAVVCPRFLLLPLPRLGNSGGHHTISTGNRITPVDARTTSDNPILA